MLGKMVVDCRSLCILLLMITASLADTEVKVTMIFLPERTVELVKVRNVETDEFGGGCLSRRVISLTLKIARSILRSFKAERTLIAMVSGSSRTETCIL